MLIQDLGLMPYTDAWKIQETAHENVLAGGPERIFLVEHPPVITYGRRPGIDKHLLASKDQLEKLGVEIVQSDRGGDITFHGPGQLVVYPIIRLVDHRLSVSGYVHLLENIIISTLETFQLPTAADPSAVGVWTTGSTCGPAKVCAIGVRIRRGVTLHGLALNVTTDLRFFDLIVPCGLQNRPVTSLQQQLGDRAPKIAEVKNTLIAQLISHLQPQAGSEGTPEEPDPASNKSDPSSVSLI
jgi:lipoate-protein ligase B